MTKEFFSCKQCGHCCHGETTVSLTEEDQKRLAGYLKLSIEQMKNRYMRVNGNLVQMKIIDGHCIFFNHGCTVHPAKPWRCTQWPLHPSILDDESNFSAIQDSCPGLNGDLSYREFCKKFMKHLETESMD